MSCIFLFVRKIVLELELNCLSIGTVAVVEDAAGNTEFNLPRAKEMMRT
jgi:hypothetical protein